MARYMAVNSATLISVEMVLVGRNFIENSQKPSNFKENQLFNWLAYPCRSLRTCHLVSGGGNLPARLNC